MFNAEHWAKEGTEVINGIVDFTLTDDQKKRISRHITGMYRDIVADQRELLAREFDERALKAKDAEARQLYNVAAMNLRNTNPSRN